MTPVHLKARGALNGLCPPTLPPRQLATRTGRRRAVLVRGFKLSYRFFQAT